MLVLNYCSSFAMHLQNENNLMPLEAEGNDNALTDSTPLLILLITLFVIGIGVTMYYWWKERKDISFMAKSKARREAAANVKPKCKYARSFSATERTVEDFIRQHEMKINMSKIRRSI